MDPRYPTPVFVTEGLKITFRTRRFRSSLSGVSKKGESVELESSAAYTCLYFIYLMTSQLNEPSGFIQNALNSKNQVEN